MGESGSIFVERLVGVFVLEGGMSLRLDGVDGSCFICAVDGRLNLRLFVGGEPSLSEIGAGDNEDSEETECERVRFV